MPNLFCHYLTGKRAARRASALSAQRGDPHDHASAVVAANARAYRLGMQGPDILFYYNAAPWRHSAEAIRLGFLLHEHTTSATFARGLEYALGGPRADRPVALAYLAGLATHLCLDAEVHPWVLYWTGDITEGAPEADRMRALRRHNLLETNIDAELVARAAGAAGTKWLRRQRLLAVSAQEAGVIGRLYEHVLREAHGERFAAAEVVKAIRDMTWAYDLLTDERRLATRLMVRVAVPFDRHRLIRDSVYPAVPDPAAVGLMRGARAWRRPTEPGSVRREGFDDLLDRAVENSAAGVAAILSAGRGTLSVEAAVAAIGDRNMLTGAAGGDRRPLTAFAPGLKAPG